MGALYPSFHFFYCTGEFDLNKVLPSEKKNIYILESYITDTQRYLYIKTT